METVEERAIWAISDLVKRGVYRNVTAAERGLGIAQGHTAKFRAGRVGVPVRLLAVLVERFGYCGSWLLIGGPLESRFRTAEARADHQRADDAADWQQLRTIAAGLLAFIERGADRRGVPREGREPGRERVQRFEEGEGV